MHRKQRSSSFQRSVCKNDRQGGFQNTADDSVGTLNDCTEYGLKKNPLSEKLFLESTITARAYENTCAIVFVNAGGAVGATKPGTYAGMSRVAVPFLGALGDETKDSIEEGMSIVDIDMEILEEAENNYKVREDMKRDDWHYTYRHDNFNKMGKL